jgi:hypothetical protein
LRGLVSSYALPTFGQEKNTVDPEVRQQIESLLVKGDEAYNKRDATAFADSYSDEAVFVGGGGGAEPHYGRQANAHVVFQQVVFGDCRKHHQEAFGKRVGFGHT